MSLRPSRRFSKPKFPVLRVNPSRILMINLPLPGRSLSSATGGVHPEPCTQGEESLFPPHFAPTWFSVSFPKPISPTIRRATIPGRAEARLHGSAVSPCSGSRPPVGKVPISSAYPLDHELLPLFDMHWRRAMLISTIEFRGGRCGGV